jgi:hypothetical protein
MLRGRIISDGQRFEKIVPLSAIRNSQCNAECERPKRRCPSSTPRFAVAANVYSFAAQMEELKQRLRLRRSVASLSLFDDRQN